MDNQKIENMKIGGKILAETLCEVLDNIKPGITEEEIDKMAESLIVKKGGQPAFKKVPGYKHTICISTNDVVVHGIPKKRVIKEGDIVGVDCGVFYNGYYTDMAETVKVQESRVKSQEPGEIDRFLKTGKNALLAGIKEAQAGNRIGHISKAIQDIVEGAGYAVVRSLVGHGVGKQLHEKPEVPGYLNKKLENTPPLKSGMTIAIEVIYNMGTSEVVYDGTDDWTISTADRKLSGLFERTILITENKPVILTEI